MLTTTRKPKECATCGSSFMPFRPMASVCSPVCARRKVEADKKAEKERFKARKENVKTIADLIEEAQEAFNAFIRARDHGKPCICCGKPMERDAWGNPKVNAGHWRSRGAAGHLRFDEANVHAQRTSCNRPGGARPGPFREGMIARVGLAEVERMEQDNSIEKWDRDVLRQLKTIYRAKKRAIEKERA